MTPEQRLILQTHRERTVERITASVLDQIRETVHELVRNELAKAGVSTDLTDTPETAGASAGSSSESGCRSRTPPSGSAPTAAGTVDLAVVLLRRRRDSARSRPRRSSTRSARRPRAAGLRRGHR